MSINVSKPPRLSPPKVSLRTLLIVPFVLQLFAVVGLVGWLSYENGRKAVNHLATKLQDELGARVRHELNEYLATPIQVNEMNRQAIQLGILNVQDLDNLRRHFWKQMQVYPTLGYLNFGTTGNLFLGVGREDDGMLYLELMKEKDKGRYQRYNLDNQGNPTTIITREDYLYKEDAWYSNAVKANQPTWSSIYQWGDRPEVISISSSYPLFNNKKELIGVIGIDLILSQISHFLKSLQVSPSIKIFIMERNGLIVASSSHESPYVKVDGQAKRLKASESRDPLIQTTTKQLIQQFGRLDAIQTPQHFNFKSEQEMIFAKVIPWQDKLGLNWLIVMAIPESDFMAEIHANTQRTILLSIVALAIATGVGIVIARAITQPIFQVNKASQNMAQGQLNQQVEAPEIIELEELATSFNRMAEQLQEAFETLEEKVQNRTAELAVANAEISELNQKLKAENYRMSSELDILQKMQQLILPRPEELAAIQELDIAGYMQPADEMGGDYYDVLETNGIVTIGIGDVTGHGLESGILMVMTQAAVRILSEIQEDNPIRFLNTLNATIYGNVQRMNSDKNLTLAILNYAQGKLTISGQHEETLIVRFGGEVERISTMDLGLPLGLDEDISKFISNTLIDLNPGDGIVLYTDGITEAHNHTKQQYGVERLCDIVSRNWFRTAEEIKDAVIEDVHQFMGKQKQFDDITLLVLKQR